MHKLRFGVLSLGGSMLFASACSASSQGPTDASTDHASSTTDASDAAMVTDAMDAMTDSASQSDSQPNEGQCAACTANQCLPQLEACGSSQGCTDDLVTFNNCLSAQQSGCGTTLAAGGSAQASLWACLSTLCASSCGTN
jgi:hypothetical protein